MIQPPDINPSKSDKFSLRLYNFMRNPRIKESDYMKTVHRDKEGILWIGSIDKSGWFTGARLMAILCGVDSAKRMGCYPNAQSLWKLKEVKSFWPRYLKIGRCAIDPDHKHYFVGGTGRFVQKGKKRTCQWCGQVQSMRIEREVIKHERWSNI